ncbi:Vps54-domain-containing protein [Macrolepiota fuliginosa MF-IS2]|uniref:Vps54-domain-containing protein n=1 Tax=Macrolepiota fuliginosa MF-IS2 TaxID=1400762 RepID=A0A9P5XA62_9AGAR|nr:Vps54-domain-containing protein [Macrolepiota fuliginosa MF-IS2]
MSDLSDTPSRPATPTADHIPTARPYRFTWDPSTRRPGPESVSGTTEGRGADYFNPPTPTPFPLGVLNTSTTSLTLGALPNEWSSSKHGFHAISTVLNNPHKKQDPPKAHSSLPAVPPADLPRVRRKDFDSYLRAIAPEWERFERNNRLGREGQAQLDSQEHGDDNITPRASIASDSAQLTPIAGAPSRRASVIPTPTSATSRTIPPLETVPSVFFQPAFDLADPVIFAKVAEQPDDANSRLSPTTPTQATTSSSRSINASSSAPTPMDYITDPMSSLSHTPPLLDKFSHYADTVEQHLVREISIRSTSFFAALTNLQELQSESDVCLDRIARLRNLLKDVDEKTAKKGLEVVRKCGEVGRVQNVKDAVRGVGGVVEMTKVARGLVGAGQYGEALGVVEALERMWEGESEEERREVNGRLETMVEESEDGQITQEQEQKTLGFPLSGLAAFSELPNHLRVLTLEIATSLSQEMVVVLRHDLEERISRSQGTPDVKVNGNAGDKEKVEGLQDRLKPSLQNLVRTRGLRDAILSWREFVLGEVKGVVKGAVSGFDKEWDEDKEENRTNLIQHLKSMQHTEFMPILQRVYQHFLALIEGIQTQNNVINDLLESIQTTLAKRPSTSKKATASLNITEDLIDLLASTTELSHTTCSKLLHARTETHALLPLPSFLTLYIDSMSFVVKCEVICRRMIIGLRGVVLRQASVYLSKFHQGRIERCARVVLDEPWNQVEVGGEVQDIVDILVKCAVMDAEELRIEVEGVVFGGLGAMMNGVNGKGSGNGRSVAHSPVKSNSTSPTLGGGVRILPSTKSYAELSDPGTVLISGANKSAKGNPKHLKIEDRSYYIVAATAEVLILLVDYLKIVVNLSTLTKDTISKVVEFLMTFNSRTCQLVLGAGAMRSAGLKHITAKHLALASQSLSVVSELVPYVRETFRRHLNQAEAVLLVDFDKLKRDYQVHQTEIHAKLISIMGDRLTAHIESLKV